MDKNLAGKKCFVIMPFGQKEDLNGKTIDFDKIYVDFIKDTISDLGLTCVRCDEIGEAGSIHAKMFEHIYEADIAIVDTTALNANVFYELGIRHALNKCVTILMRQPGTKTPFNIQGYQMLDYDPENLESVSKATSKIGEFIKNGLAERIIDSPVYGALDNLRVERKPKNIEKKAIYLYRIRGVPGKEIGVITGDIYGIKEVDVWVNSENTNMEMARPFDRSVSGTIRYMGAKKDRAGRVVDDLIANELRAVAGTSDVPPGTVIDTTSGELKKSNKVKKIFHAAAVNGQVGRGYVPIPDISVCVRNALLLADSEQMQSEDIHSILFPLMGTGTTRGSAQETADQLIDAAVSYIEENPQSQIDTIYFLAYNEQDREICRHKFINDPRIETPDEPSAVMAS
jgi:O-acetyl-ADP-ribose deacetylase (regulator of RNase III)